MQRNSLLSSSLSALVLVACCGALGGCDDDEALANAEVDGGGAPELDGSTGESPKDAGRDAYVWNPMGGMGGGSGGGSGGSGSGGSGSGGTGGGGSGGLDGRMCAEPRDYLPAAFLPRCSADTAACIAGCVTEADADACRDACISADTTPAETQFGLDCAACIYLTLFACIDMTACHNGVAEVFCCIEDNCPTGSAEGCADRMCGGDIEAAVICGYNADQDCVDFAGDVLGQCFAASNEDAGR
jgi:hypothetical protein